MWRMIPERAVLFVDGNNWYHGLKKIGVDAYGLDYPRVAKKLLKGRALAEIRFYVGKVREDRGRIARQQKDLDRLEYQGLKVVLGRIQRNLIPPSENPMAAELETVLRDGGSQIPDTVRQRLEQLCEMPVPDYVEKKVDVSIAVDLIRMAYRDEYDVAYLLSADADFVPAVRETRKLGKTVFVVRSWASRSADRKMAADTVIPLRSEWFDGMYRDDS